MSFWLGSKFAFKPCKVINLQGLEESLEIGGNGGIVLVIVTSCCHCMYFITCPIIVEHNDVKNEKVGDLARVTMLVKVIRSSSQFDQ